jgi:hypothetical protein
MTVFILREIDNIEWPKIEHLVVFDNIHIFKSMYTGYSHGQWRKYGGGNLCVVTTFITLFLKTVTPYIHVLIYNGTYSLHKKSLNSTPLSTDTSI